MDWLCSPVEKVLEGQTLCNPMKCEGAELIGSNWRDRETLSSPSRLPPLSHPSAMTLLGTSVDAKDSHILTPAAETDLEERQIAQCFANTHSHMHTHMHNGSHTQLHLCSREAQETLGVITPASAQGGSNRICEVTPTPSLLTPHSVHLPSAPGRMAESLLPPGSAVSFY